MKKWFLLVPVLFCLPKAEAQLGLTVAPTSSLSPKWQILVENFVTEKRTNFLEYGATGLVDFRLPLWAKGWSFQPTAHGMSTAFDFDENHFDVYLVGFQPNVNLELFQKTEKRIKTVRPFLQFSPGIDFIHKRFSRPVDEQGQFLGGHEKFTDKNWALSFGLNFLVEFRLTSLLSMSPQMGFRYFPEVTWNGFTGQVSDGQLSEGFDRTDWRQLSFGLRIGLDLKNARRE